jgi:uncharacterized protein (TIGR04222 family)
MMRLLDPYSPYCITLFAVLLAAVLAFTWPARYLLARLRPPHADTDGLDDYEIAYLLGGADRAVYVALAALLGRGVVAVREGRRTVVATGGLPADAHPVEQATFRALATLGEDDRYGERLLPALALHAAGPLREVEERLHRRGLSVSQRASERQTRHGVYSLLGYASVAFLVALIPGRPGHLPWPMLSLVIGAVAAGFGLVLKAQVRTHAGVRAASDLIARGFGDPFAARPSDAPVRAPAGVGGDGGDHDPLTALRRTLMAPPMPGAANEAAEDEWVDVGPWEGSPPPAGLGEFGYVMGAEAHACSQAELTAMCRDGRVPRLVWTPASPLLVHPTGVPWLFGPLREVRVRARAKPVSGGVIQIVTFLAFWDASGLTFPSFWMVMAVAEAISVYPAFREWQAAKRLTPAQLRLPAAPVVFTEWALRAREKKALYTPWVLRALLAVGAVQLVPGFHSVEAAGLVKSAVRSGEWWRLLTAPTLHGNVWHFAGNYAALRLLGAIVESYGRRVHLPVVLVLSALAGSVASQLLLPATSVGISGGIMGCVGYLLVLGWRYRTSVAPGFFQAMVRAAAITALIGLVGYGVIDNAAHGGGLVAGLAGGLVLVPRRGLDEQEDEPERTTAAGWIWTSLFFAMCALAVVMILAS